MLNLEETVANLLLQSNELTAICTGGIYTYGGDGEIERDNELVAEAFDGFSELLPTILAKSLADTPLQPNTVNAMRCTLQLFFYVKPEDTFTDVESMMSLTYGLLQGITLPGIWFIELNAQTPRLFDEALQANYATQLYNLTHSMTYSTPQAS